MQQRYEPRLGDPELIEPATPRVFDAWQAAAHSWAWATLATIWNSLLRETLILSSGLCDFIQVQNRRIYILQINI